MIMTILFLVILMDKTVLVLGRSPFDWPVLKKSEPDLFLHKFWLQHLMMQDNFTLWKEIPMLL